MIQIYNYVTNINNSFLFFEQAIRIFRKSNWSLWHPEETKTTILNKIDMKTERFVQN